MKDQFRVAKFTFSLSRQLGFDSGTATVESYFGTVPSAFSMDDVGCNATDTTIQDCSYKDEHHENCGQNEGAGVKCHNYDQSSSGKKSLVKGED